MILDDLRARMRKMSPQGRWLAVNALKRLRRDPVFMAILKANERKNGKIKYRPPKDELPSRENQNT